jgi:hypothetical protein
VVDNRSTVLALATPEQVEKFRQFDRDGDGYLGLAEMRELATSLYVGAEWDDSNWGEMCSELGADSTRGLSINQFVSFQQMMDGQNTDSDTDADTDVEIPARAAAVENRGLHASVGHADNKSTAGMGLQGMMKPPPAVNVDLAAKFASGKQSSRASSLASSTPTDAMQRTQSEMAAQRAKGAEQVRELTAMTPRSAASKGQSGGAVGKSGIPRSTKGTGRWKQRGSARSAAQPAAIVPSEQRSGDADDSDEDEFLQSPLLQGSNHVEHGAAAPVASGGPALPPRDVAGTDAAQVATNAAPPLPARDLPQSAAAATSGAEGVHATKQDDVSARAEADEMKGLAEQMEEAGGLEDPEAYERAKALYAQGLWMQAAELFAQAVGDEDI